MFTSQSLRAVVKPGALVVREQRLDDVVHQLDVRGTLDAATVGELGRRIDAALAGGVRWLIVDIADTVAVADEALEALVTAARELRSRKGELIVAGAKGGAAERLAAFEVAHRPGAGGERRPGDHDPQDAAAEDGHPVRPAAREAAHHVAHAAADRADDLARSSTLGRSPCWCLRP